MRSDTASSLLLEQPLPLSAISLGRFVRDPLYPDVDYYDPAVPAAQEQGRPTFTPHIVEHRFENFESTLEAARDTRLELGLLQMLSLAPLSSHRGSSTSVRSRLCVVRQLRNADAFFSAACRDDRGARAWLESEAERPSSRRGVFVVCGFKTLTDAVVSQRSSRGSGVDVSAELPVAAIAAAAACAPLPLPGSLTTSVRVGVTSAEILAYTAPGERVYSVLYRRVRFSWFSTRSSVDRAYLEKGIRWKSMIGSRGDGDEDEDGFEVQMAGMPKPDELDGAFDSVEIGGEQIFFTDGNDTDESDEYWSS
ncbi:hypothetical protein RB595_004099 [Gaeumannomyces hyphopodioides]